MLVSSLLKTLQLLSSHLTCLILVNFGNQYYLPHRNSTFQLPAYCDPKTLPETFASFKVQRLQISLSSVSNDTSPVTELHLILIFILFYCCYYWWRTKLICLSANTFCNLDPIPTSLLKKCLPKLLPTFTEIINLSLSTGVFHNRFKTSVILLKKSDNYLLISHWCPFCNSVETKWIFFSSHWFSTW